MLLEQAPIQSITFALGGTDGSPDGFFFENWEFNGYVVADSTPPASPSKGLSVLTYASNCTVQMTTSEVEANFDNVIINQ